MHNEVDYTQKAVAVLGKKLESSKDAVMDSFSYLEFSMQPYLCLFISSDVSQYCAYRDDE